MCIRRGQTLTPDDSRGWTEGAAGTDVEGEGQTGYTGPGGERSIRSCDPWKSGCSRFQAQHLRRRTESLEQLFMSFLTFHGDTTLDNDWLIYWLSYFRRMCSLVALTHHLSQWLLQMELLSPWEPANIDQLWLLLWKTFNLDVVVLFCSWPWHLLRHDRRFNSFPFQRSIGLLRSKNTLDYKLIHILK